MEQSYTRDAVLPKHVISKKNFSNSSKNKTRGKLKLVFLLVVLLLLSYFSKATHIVGGTLNYTWNGGDNYTVTLILYRDC